MSSVKSPRVFNIFYGDEPYLLDRELRRAMKWPRRHVIALDGATTSEVALVEAMGDIPADDSDGIIVVVDNADELKLKGPLLSYVNERDLKERSSVLVGVYRGAQLTKGWAEVAQKGRATAHFKLKPWEQEKIKERVAGELASFGLKLEDDAFDVLFALHAESTACIVNDVRKAAYLSEKGTPISKEGVLAVCGRKYSTAPWAVSEAAFAKDAKRALRAVALLVQDRGDEALVPIVAALMRQLETFVVLRQLLDQQASVEAMGAALGIHPYRVRKDLGAVKKHTVPGLLSQMKNLCELEAQIKGAATAKRTRVELAVLSLAA